MNAATYELRQELALERLQMVRRLTTSFLEDLGPEEWFRAPQPPVTHIAWQIGHLAVAEWALCIARHRAETDADEQLLPKAFRTQFGRGSTPVMDPGANPPWQDIRATFDRVHEACVAAIQSYPPADLAGPVLMPHPLFDQRIGALLWCSEHEMMHVGQIALLRRLLGRTPKW